MSKFVLGNDLYIRGRIGWRGLSKDEYLEKSEYKIINATALMDGYVDWDNCGYISKERYEESDEIMLQENDILISKDGTLGKIGYVKNLTTPCTVASGIFVVRNTIPEILDFDYLYHILKSNIFKDFIRRNKAEGSTINHLYQRDLVNFEIDLPEINMQKKIARVLNDLDNKIENNNKIKAELESMAKTIYDYWFLQFEFPNEDGKPYKSSGGKMVWNEELKREIPEGWEVLKVGNISKSNRGVSYTSNDLDNNGTPMLTLGCANKDGSFNFDGIQHYVGGYSGNKELLPYDLIIYNTDMSSACYVVGRTILVPAIFNKVISSHHLTTIHFDNDNYKWYFYQLSQTDYFRKYIIGFSTGSNVKGLDYSGIENFSHEFPNDAILTKFVDILRPIHEKISKIMLENQELVSLRDFLLPMLMNGQIGFKDKK